MKAFNLSDIDFTKYLFFTGKGGVGKTSTLLLIRTIALVLKS